MVINITYDDEFHVEGYGSPASIKVQTINGKKYSFLLRIAGLRAWKDWKL